MRRLFPFFAALLIGASSLAVAPASNQLGTNAILVLPFAAPAGPDAWIGKAVQQDLLTDLSQGTTSRVMAPADVPPAADPAAARKAGQDAGAAIVVFGQVQTSGGQMRFSGQVLDVSTGSPLGNLKATGSAADLFHLEDGLSGQTLAAVPRSMLSPAALRAEQQAAQPAAQQPAPAAPQQPAVEPPGPQQPGGYSVTTQGSGYTPPAAADTYAPPPSGPYVYGAAPDTSYVYNYYEPTPAYGFGCPVPAYTYGCPTFDLFPFGGPFLFFDFDGFHHFHDRDFDDFHHFHDHDFDGDWHNGWFHHDEGHGNGLGHGTGRTGVAGSRFGTSAAGSSTFARTGTPRGLQSRGGVVSGGPTARSFRGAPSMSRGSVSGLRARSFSGSQSFSSGPRFYGGANASGFRGLSGGSRSASSGGFRGMSGGGFRGGISGGGFHSGFSGGGFHGGGGGFHGGGGGFGGGGHGGAGGGRR